MKICKKCGEEKNISEFYVHKKMGDGYLSFCKDCVKKRIHKHYYSNIKWGRLKEKARYERRKKNPDFIKKRKEYDSKYKSNPLFKNVAKLLKRIYKARPDYCEMCKKHKDELSWTIHAHHPDYNKPEKIKWLCAACHKQVHLKMKRIAGVA